MTDTKNDWPTSRAIAECLHAYARDLEDGTADMRQGAHREVLETLWQDADPDYPCTEERFRRWLSRITGWACENIDTAVARVLGRRWRGYWGGPSRRSRAMTSEGRYTYDVRVGRLPGGLGVDDAMPKDYLWVTLSPGEPWTRASAFAFVESRREQPEGTTYEILRRKAFSEPWELLARFFVGSDGLAHEVETIPLSPEANTAQVALFALPVGEWTPLGRGDRGVDELVRAGLAERNEDGRARLAAVGRMRQRGADASSHLYRVRAVTGLLVGHATAIVGEAEALAAMHRGATIERRRTRGAKSG